MKMKSVKRSGERSGIIAMVAMMAIDMKDEHVSVIV